MLTGTTGWADWILTPDKYLSLAAARGCWKRQENEHRQPNLLPEELLTQSEVQLLIVAAKKA